MSLVKPFLFLLKTRKKQILIGVSGALLISSFFLQFYIQILLVNPAIGKYVHLISDEGQSITEITGLHDINEETNKTFLTEMQSSYYKTGMLIPGDVNETIKSLNIWATKKYITKTVFQIQDSNFSIRTINAFSGTEFIDIIELTSKSYEQKYPNSSFTEFDSIDGVLFIDDVTNNISEISGGKINHLNLTIESELPIINSGTDNYRNLSLMLFPISFINTSLWLNPENNPIYCRLNQTGTLNTFFSCLTVSETKITDIDLGAFYYGNEGEMDFPINIIFQFQFYKEKLVDNLINNTLFSSHLSSTTIMVNQLLKSHDCFNLRVIDYTRGIKDIISQYQLIFLIVQLVIQFPTLVFVLFSFRLFNSYKNHNFREQLLDKLLLKGYSRIWILTYAFMEFIVIMLIIFSLTSLLSILLVSIPLMLIDWSDFWATKVSFLQQIFLKILTNLESKIFLVIILFIGDFFIWKNVLISVPTLDNSTRTIPDTSSVISPSMKIRIMKLGVYFTLGLVAVFSSLSLEENLIKQSNEMNLLFIIILQVISVLILVLLTFISGGLFVANKLSVILANTHHVFGVVQYFLISRKNQRLLMASVVFALVTILSLSTTYNTFLSNGQRNADNTQGTDVRIVGSIPLDSDYLEKLSTNVSEIQLVTVVNKTTSTLGTQFSLINENNYSIVVIDPAVFFEVAYTESGFFEKLSVNELKLQLDTNNTILVNKYDSEKLDDINQNSELLITGYSNESKIYRYQWRLKIIDYFSYWPTLTFKELHHESVQLIMGPKTFKTLTSQINLSIQAEYWIKIKDQSLEELNEIDFLVPPDTGFNVDKKINTDDTHPVSLLIDALFTNTLYITMVFVVIMIIQSYIIVLFHDFYTKKHDIGIFRSMGISSKQSVVGLVLNFLILNIIVILPLIASLLTLFPVIRMIILLSQSVPIIIIVDTKLLLLLIGALISSSFIPIIFFIPIAKQPIVSLIKNYD